MMNDKYILCKLDNKRNAFIVDVYLTLDIHNFQIVSCAVIDTGCSKTSISIQSNSIGVGYSLAMEMKQDAIDSASTCYLSFGANDSSKFKLTQKSLLNADRIMECTAVKFNNKISNFSINGYNIPVNVLGVSYDRVSPVLIGMDILNLLEYHVGESLHDDADNRISRGDRIFLACMKSKMNSDFIELFNRCFGYLPDVGYMKYLIKEQMFFDNDAFVLDNYNL